MLSTIPLTWNEALSGITGSISLAAWIFLLIPQLIENYRQGSADGISLTFLFIWFVGDITNLAGALWAGLVPTVTALAVYFCFADAILISQCLYYHARNQRRSGEHRSDGMKNAPERALAVEQAEDTPLLDGNEARHKSARSQSFGDVTEDNMGLPGSRRRSSVVNTRHRDSDHRRNSLERILEEPSTSASWVKNAVSILLIFLVGAAGWAVAYKTGAWQPTPTGSDDDAAPGEATPVGAEVLGYISAVLYLGARIPQIVKNQRERSCDGLSLLFFLLSLCGNATYGAGILFHSVERQYVMTNLPWLIGSLGTMAEDAIIFVQFSVFGEKTQGAAVERTM